MSREAMISELRQTLVKLPERDRKSYLRGWMQVDKKYYKPKRKQP